jgi:streptogramin lyase
MAKMNMQKITHNMKSAVCSGTRVLMLASIIAAVVIVFPSTAWSQTPEWSVYNTANSGLPYNGITALAIDEQGNAWVGTGRWWAQAGGGLAKFDGENWTVFNTANSPLPHNDHVSLSIDAQGNIWSGTENGLSKFDGVNWTVYKTNNSGLPSNRTGAPAFDAEGNAWIATFSNGGLARFDGENWTVYRTNNSGMPSNDVADVAIDAQGNIWASTLGSGVAKFDGQNWTVYNRTNSGIPHNDTSFLSIDGQDNVWIGTYGGGLAKFDGAKWIPYNSANSGLPDNWIWNLNVDPKGNVWAGTKAGLAKFDGVNWTVFNISNSSLPDNNVYCVAFDARGNVWIGTQSGGLVVYWQPPVIDFNSDGIVDSADMCMMIDYWGTDELLYDIAPLPSGDGIVDVKDLILLSEHLFEEILPPELVAYWKFDETEGAIAYELAGSKDGYLFGDPVWQPNDGIKDGALQFDGIDDYVLSTFNSNPAHGPFSVFGWIKGGTPGQAIISQMDGSGNGETWLGIDSLNGCLMTELVAPPIGRFISQPLESNQIITDDIWHHIGFVWDGSYRILYVDGIEVAKDTNPLASLKNSDGGLYIGANKNRDAGTFFSGLIDDVRIYDIALNAEEIAALEQ